MAEVVAWGALALLVLAVAFACGAVASRTAAAWRRRRATAAEAAAEPLALAVADGGEAPVLHGRRDRAFERLLRRYALQLTGPARARVAVALDETGAVDRALAALRARRPTTRARAAQALGEMGATRATGALLRALDDRDRDVRAVAARSLAAIGAVEAVRPLAAAATSAAVPRAVVGAALLQLGVPAVPALAELVRDRDPAIRAFALEILGLGGNVPPEIVGVLHRALGDPAAAVRAEAARALGRLGDEDAARPLIALVGDRIPSVRAAAAAALRALGDVAAVEPLVPVARGDDFDAAAAAAATIAHLDLAAAQALADDGSSLHIAAAVDAIAARR